MNRPTLPRVVLLLVALAALACAQAPPTQAWPGSAFLVSVVNDQGTVANDLGMQDFDVWLGERRAPVTGLTHFQQAPIRIIIVLDESPSMAARWKLARAIIFELLRTLPPNSNVKLVGINDAAPELIESPASILRYLTNRSRRGPGRWTNLWDDMHLALLGFKQPRPSDVIFVLSDGVDNASKLPFRQLQDEVRAARVRVSGVLLSDPNSPEPEARTSVPNFLELIDETGGWNLTAPPFTRPATVTRTRMEPTPTGPPNLAGFFQTLYSFYLVDLGPAITHPEPVRVHIAATYKDHERTFVSAPQRLVPATP